MHWLDAQKHISFLHNLSIFGDNGNYTSRYFGLNLVEDFHGFNEGNHLSNLDDIEYRARRVVETMALVLQGSLLVRFGEPAVSDAFCAARFGGDHGGAFGTLPSGVDTQAIIARATV